LHHPDLAPGTSHFRLSIEEGQKIVSSLRGRISGLCQPTYILDIPGGYGKAVIGYHFCTSHGLSDLLPDFSGYIKLLIEMKY